MKRKVFVIGIILFFGMLTACGRNENILTKELLTETSITYDSEISEQHTNVEIDSIEKITNDKMQDIIDEFGLENAVVYNSEIEDVAKDTIVFLCESPSGHFKAYGFISPEYGKQGILIDNIIDDESIHNFYHEKWFYSKEQLSLSESDDFYYVAFKICQDREEGMKSTLQHMILAQCLRMNGNFSSI